MDFKEYIESSISKDVDLADELCGAIVILDNDFDWVRLGDEIEIKKYDLRTKEAEIIANWIAESLITDSSYYGKIKFEVKIEPRGNKPAKFTLIHIIEISDKDRVF